MLAHEKCHPLSRCTATLSRLPFAVDVCRRLSTCVDCRRVSTIGVCRLSTCVDCRRVSTVDVCRLSTCVDCRRVSTVDVCRLSTCVDCRRVSFIGADNSIRYNFDKISGVDTFISSCIHYWDTDCFNIYVDSGLTCNLNSLVPSPHTLLITNSLTFSTEFCAGIHIGLFYLVEHVPRTSHDWFLKTSAMRWARRFIHCFVFFVILKYSVNFCCCADLF